MEDSKLVAVTLMSAGGRASSCGEVRSSNNARRVIKSYENTTCTTISMRIEVVNHFEGLRRE
jgi:hypothetical protein